MDISNLGALAGSLARAGLPALSTILGVVVPPPYNLMVGPAFAAISTIMGVDPAAPDAPAQVQAKVDADPAGAAEKLQVVEQAHKDAADAANEELRIRTADVQDARAEEVKRRSTPLSAFDPSIILATIAVVGFCALSAWGLAYGDPSTKQGLLSAWQAFFASVIFYYFGSSKGSSDKTAALTDMARSPTVQAQPGSHVSSGVITGNRR